MTTATQYKTLAGGYDLAAAKRRASIGRAQGLYKVVLNSYERSLILAGFAFGGLCGLAMAHIGALCS